MHKEEISHKLDLLKIHKTALGYLGNSIATFGVHTPPYIKMDYESRLKAAKEIVKESIEIIKQSPNLNSEDSVQNLEQLIKSRFSDHALFICIIILEKTLETPLERSEIEILEKFLSRPVVILSFANNKENSFLKMVDSERKKILSSFESRQDDLSIHIDHESQTTLEDIFDKFRRYKDRIVIFHFGGHANGASIQLESMDHHPMPAYSKGLAKLLGSEQNLKLVFLNGCATGPHVNLLLQSGVKAVIATSVSVGDEMAMEFSEQFYKNFSNRSTLKESFELASGFIESKYEFTTPIRIYREAGRGISLERNEIPWGLFIGAGFDQILEWRI